MSGGALGDVSGSDRPGLIAIFLIEGSHGVAGVAVVVLWLQPLAKIYKTHVTQRFVEEQATRFFFLAAEWEWKTSPRTGAGNQTFAPKVPCIITIFRAAFRACPLPKQPGAPLGM